MMDEKDNAKAGKLNIDYSGIATSYANFSHIHINPADLYMYFGVQPNEGEVENVKIESRVIMTHDVFMQMMEFWSTRYSILKEIYGDTPRNLRDFNSETVRELFEKYLEPVVSDSEEE